MNPNADLSQSTDTESGNSANGEAPSDRTCIVGAGSTGIAAAKALKERGIPFDCYELGDRVGGNWVYKNKNGVSSSYKTLHINTSRERMEYSDFPMPKSYPDFPRHDHIAKYFDDYVDHFGFREQIIFNTGIKHVERRPDGRFDVELSTGDEQVYSHVLVANGHHWDPRMPEPAFPGAEESSIEQIHSHHYEHESQLTGKKVVVLGMGNSAMDIAVDASYHADAVYLAHRRGAHIMPKYIGGKPVDQIGASERIPFAVRKRMFSALLRTTTGKMENYGLKKPDHGFGDAHPTVSGRILDRLSHGAITPKPNIVSLGESTVRFDDGTEVEADLVVYCTGYRISFPFFDDTWINAEDNRIDLFKRVFYPGEPNLYFLGLVQPLGAIMPIAERQSELVAADIVGAYQLPPRSQMEHEISVAQEKMLRRYVASKRHTIQVDYDDYMKELRIELESTTPVPARAGA